MYHIICLLECYKNIYELHRFPIEKFSIIEITHLFSQFHTIFCTFCSPLISTKLLQNKQKNKMNNSRDILWKGKTASFHISIISQIWFFSKIWSSPFYWWEIEIDIHFTYCKNQYKPPQTDTNRLQKLIWTIGIVAIYTSKIDDFVYFQSFSSFNWHQWRQFECYLNKYSSDSLKDYRNRYKPS